MNHAKRNYRFNLLQLFVSLGLFISCATVSAAFFEDVDENVIPEKADGSFLIIENSISSPDGRFTYVSGSDEIFIFSRDISTGTLTQTGIHNGASYPGGAEIVTVSADHLAMSPDSSTLYMAGRFGYSSPGMQGDAPIRWQYTVVKFDRDSESGLLTFNDHVAMDGTNFKPISELALSRDGNSLVFARASGNPGTTEVYLVNTLNMESQFVLIDEQGDSSRLPSSTSLKIALSPDEQSLYLGGPMQNNRHLESVPALTVIEIDRDTNRLSVNQTLNESFFEGLDTDVDISGGNALSDIGSISPTDDGRFVYTVGRIRTAELNSASIYAIGLWRVEADGKLGLVRSMDKQELVFDVIGGSGEFSGPSGLELSPEGGHFLYAGEDQFFEGQSDLTVFARDPESGLLTYIDDNVGTIEFDGVHHIDIAPDGRFINLTQSDTIDKIVVVDTAVDRAVTLNIIDSTESVSNLPGSGPATTATLQAIVSNNGLTDDYAVNVLIAKSGNTVLSSNDSNCSALSDGNIQCRVQNLLVGNQASFDVVATGVEGSGVNAVTATASSNKIDVEPANDTDTVDINAGTVAAANEGEETEESSASTALSPSSGGCSIGGLRTSHDPGFLLLLLLTAGIFFRRVKLGTAVFDGAKVNS